ncbi:MAG: catalase family protein [Hyphomonadaceae bacterium]
MTAAAKPVARLPSHPVNYTPELDPIADDEGEVAAEITETMLGIARTTYGHSGHAIRSVHAKSHGLLKAELQVPLGLPPQLAQGVFSRPGHYPVVMRFSTVPGDLLSDKVSTPRGVAIKILGVQGDRLEGSEGATTQDFIFVNGPVFPTANPKAFLANLKLVASTTDKAEGAKEALSAVTRTTENLIETFGGKSGLLIALGGHPPTHILGETFWNQLPVRYGQHIAKLQLMPTSPELKALTNKSLDLGTSDDVIREAVIAYFRDHDAVWDIRIQLATDLDDTPIEDPSQEWKEDRSPFTTVGRITARRQLGWSGARSTAIDDGMGFSPWHSIEDHRPLGQMMRIRKLAYAESQRFRSERNATPVSEPTSLDAIPD